ncbi:hypothetical protein PPEP_a1955 [Pseudoalteromonas peptidolytica F12-50-A1]|uniref:Uncharacterized protein n=1 Tax=Pseudoalteromonas peptidolytica F12-50-A1 TaxID=1315280 RepID=A0A8I0MY68_9GAMM|nr:hypothetical protein [Pseudoalteromonas peptidolytica F12-50-A1]
MTLLSHTQCKKALIEISAANYTNLPKVRNKIRVFITWERPMSVV